ncbi:hypothetical protein [Aequorivita nionensis]
MVHFWGSQDGGLNLYVLWQNLVLGEGGERHCQNENNHYFFHSP